MGKKTPNQVDVQIHYGGNWKDDFDPHYAYYKDYIGGSCFIIEDVKIPLEPDMKLDKLVQTIAEELDLPTGRVINLEGIVQSKNFLGTVKTDGHLEAVFRKCRPHKGGGFLHFFVDTDEEAIQPPLPPMLALRWRVRKKVKCSWRRKLRCKSQNKKIDERLDETIDEPPSSYTLKEAATGNDVTGDIGAGNMEEELTGAGNMGEELTAPDAEMGEELDAPDAEMEEESNDAEMEEELTAQYIWDNFDWSTSTWGCTENVSSQFATQQSGITFCDSQPCVSDVGEQKVDEPEVGEQKVDEPEVDEPEVGEQKVDEPELGEQSVDVQDMSGPRKEKGGKKKRKRWDYLPEEEIIELPLSVDDVEQAPTAPRSDDLPTAPGSDDPLTAPGSDDPPTAPGLDDPSIDHTEEINPDDAYHSAHSSEDEMEDAEFAEFVEQTTNVFREEERHNSPEGVGTEMELVIGDVWPTLEDARSYLRDYAVFKKFTLKQIKNESDRLRFGCKSEGCKWWVYVAQTADKHTFKCKTGNLEHSCIADSDSKNPTAKAPWVAKKMFSIFLQNPNMKPSLIQEYIFMHHQTNVSYHTAWRAKEIMMEKMHGNFEEGYRLAPEMARQILVSNPGSIATCSRDDATEKFTGMCIAFKSSLDGFINGCRPILGMDGCFLKGKYGGVCLSVISIDACNGLFPVAIYICRNECKETWLSFLRTVAPRLIQHSHPLTVVSDRQKGLLDAVTEVFGNVNHRFCFRHMFKNFKKVHPGLNLERLSWQAATSYTMHEFKKSMDELEKASSQAKQWLDREEYKSWARSYFDNTCKCEHVTNNFTESFNNWIIRFRDKPLYKFVEKYHIMLMTTFYKRKLMAQEWSLGELVPRARNILSDLERHIYPFIVEPSTQEIWLVRLRSGDKWKVNLGHQTCSCCAWQLSGIPCVHAVAVLRPRREDYSKYCSTFHIVQSYLHTYDGHVEPISDLPEWDEPQYVVKPPLLIRPPGRPRWQRRKDMDEENGVHRAQKICGKCGLRGHNKKTCKGAPAEASTSGSSRTGRGDGSRGRGAGKSVGGRGGRTRGGDGARGRRTRMGGSRSGNVQEQPPPHQQQEPQQHQAPQQQPEAHQQQEPQLSEQQQPGTSQTQCRRPRLFIPGMPQNMSGWRGRGRKVPSRFFIAYQG